MVAAAPPPKPVLAHTHAGRGVIAFGILVIALLWVAIVWDLGRERTRALVFAEADTANLARLFEEHFQRTVDGLDQTLLYLKAEYERDPSRFSLTNSIANNISVKRVSVQIGVIGPDGTLVDSNVAGFSRVNLADRDHFRVHREVAGDKVFVSKPVLGRASGRWSIQLTRRLDGPDGAFAGVVVVSLDPDYLADVYNSIDIGKAGAVMLIGRDGIVRAASGQGPDIVGQGLSQSGLIESLFASRSGSHRVEGPFDRRWRIASYRSLDTLPLAVWVGRSEAEVLAAHGQMQNVALLVGGVITAVLGAALLVLYLLVRRQQDIARDLSVKKSELVASRERLKRYVADLERIAEIAAHDLQEPLRRVVAYAQLLSKHAQSALDAEGRDYIAHVVAGAQRMRKLVQDLEAFVAVDRMPTVERLVSAKDCMDSAAQRLDDEMRAAGVTLVVDSLPEVAADERSLTEIFTQLVDNAIRYRAVGRKPLIHFGVRRDGDQAVFSVRDNGIGIEPRDRARIFEIFHRLHGFDSHPGTGMGLAIVRRMIERLGGRLWVESEPGQGSVFCFTLPLAVEPVIRLDPGVQAA